MKQIFTKNRDTSNSKLFTMVFLIVSFAVLSTQTAQAKDYKVEVLVFKNLNESRASESHHYQPPKKPSSNASTWYVAPSMLLNEAARLKKSSDYQLLHHYSWGQEALPVSRAASYSLIETDLSGWVKVYANTLLFANLDLELDGYRMTEKRRLKLNEKHFFDHPKFGILMRVSRLLPKKIEADTKTDAE